MKLWILRPVAGVENWDPWYDKSFGHVVRAGCEVDARGIAAENKGDEGRDAWLDVEKSTCIELIVDGEPEHIMRDFASG